MSHHHRKSCLNCQVFIFKGLLRTCSNHFVIVNPWHHSTIPFGRPRTCETEAIEVGWANGWSKIWRSPVDRGAFWVFFPWRWLNGIFATLVLVALHLSSDIITSIFSRKRLAAIFLNIKSLSASMFFVDKQLYWILSAAFRFVYARHSAARYPHRHDRQRLAERLQVGETDQTEASSLAIQIHDCRRKCLKRHWFFTSNLRQTLDV